MKNYIVDHLHHFNASSDSGSFFSYVGDQRFKKHLNLPDKNPARSADRSQVRASFSALAMSGGLPSSASAGKCILQSSPIEKNKVLRISPLRVLLCRGSVLSVCGEFAGCCYLKSGATLTTLGSHEMICMHACSFA